MAIPGMLADVTRTYCLQVLAVDYRAHAQGSKGSIHYCLSSTHPREYSRMIDIKELTSLLAAVSLSRRIL